MTDFLIHNLRRENLLSFGSDKIGEVLTMPDITSLRKMVHGVKDVFLIEGETVLDVDCESNKEVSFPFVPVQYLLEIIREEKQSIRSFSISAGDRFFFFVHDPYALGIVTQVDVNIPMLTVVARRILEHVEIREDMQEKLTEKVKPMRSLPEDQIIISRLTPDELSELPKMIRSLLELVNGKRTLKDIVILSELPLEQAVEFIHNYRRTGKLLGIEKGFDRESVCRRLYSQS